MNKVGRNDSCPCGSGMKYKKCCIGKEHEFKLNKMKLRALPGLWVSESSPEKFSYESMEEYFEEIKSKGRVPYIISEDSEDDGDLGHNRIIEVGELCRHGHPCGGGATFGENEDGMWECLESDLGMVPPCITCGLLKDGIEIGCPNCGIALPEFSEEEILHLYENQILHIDIICPNCGCNFFQEDENGLKVCPPRKSEDEIQ